MSGLTSPVSRKAGVSHDIGEGLAGADYLRQRYSPKVADKNYLYLTDLATVTRRWSERIEGAMFDYGCGGSPYRSFFSKCSQYVRADVTPGPEIDRILRSNENTDEPEGIYDAVLSSQVLEHVAKPQNYLEECHRILKRGGLLIVTTHGMFEEHGCPNDFHRWTARGLEELVKGSGFTILESVKLSTEIRALIQLGHQLMWHLRYPAVPSLDWMLRAGQKIYRTLGVPFLNMIGSRFTEQGSVPGSDPTSLYVGVGVFARKE